jgi:hypothetical protein
MSSSSALNDASNTTPAPLVLLSSLFKIGDLVLVDNLTRAYIVEIKNAENNETISFAVNYVIGDELESNVSFNRIKVIAMNHCSDTRSGNNCNSIPPSSHTQNNAKKVTI